jgi:hypothetical protein
MPGNKIQVASATGKIKVRGLSGKIIVAGAGDPCCCGTPCGDCDVGTDPATVKLTFAGWTINTGCKTAFSVGSAKINSFSIGGAFCLPKCANGLYPDGCFWGDIFTGIVDIDAWCGALGSNTTCAGTRDDHLIYLAITAFRSGLGTGRWDVDVTAGSSINSACTVTSSCYPIVGGGRAQSLIQAYVDFASDCSTFRSAMDLISTNELVNAGTIALTPNGC